MVTISGEKTGQREEERRLPIDRYFDIGRYTGETVIVGD